MRGAALIATLFVSVVQAEQPVLQPTDQPGDRSAASADLNLSISCLASDTVIGRAARSQGRELPGAAEATPIWLGVIARIAPDPPTNLAELRRFEEARWAPFAEAYIANLDGSSSTDLSRGMQDHLARCAALFERYSG